MSAKHTPGPWTIDEGRDGTTAGIYGPNSEGHRAGVEVCTVWGPERNVFVARANARLIAAAPELLEALEEMLILADNERVRPTNYAVTKARAAIVKARN